MKKSLLGLMAICEMAFCDTKSNTYEGWYLAAGINYQHTSCKITQSDSLGVLNAICKTNEVKPNSGLIGGSIIGGYGTLVNRCCYVGAEVVLDISKDSKHSYEIERDELAGLLNIRVNTKIKGFVPGAAVRLGYLAKSIDTLFYLTAGISYVETKVEEIFENRTVWPIESSSGTLNKKKFVPTIGVGIEKELSDHFNVRLEGAWRFSSSKKKSNEDDIQVIRPGGMQEIIRNVKFEYKNQSSGYVIRLISSYVF